MRLAIYKGSLPFGAQHFAPPNASVSIPLVSSLDLSISLLSLMPRRQNLDEFLAQGELKSDQDEEGIVNE